MKREPLYTSFFRKLLSNSKKSAAYELLRLIVLVLIGILLMQLVSFGQDLSQIGHTKPLTFTGGLQARSMVYNVSGIPNRQEKFNYVFDGNFTANVYGWSIPFSFTFSPENKDFRQPFNKFGLSPQYKWVTVHLGYRNLNFSPYTLAGHTILGAGVELNPGKLRTAFVYGKLNRATVIDTTTLSLVPYSFSRTGMALKLGYGTKDNYFDLSFLTAKDDTTSAPVEFIGDDAKVLAEANSVLGYQTRFSIIDKFFFESDGAVSLYTRDINSPLSLDSANSSFLENLKNTFNVNGSSSLLSALGASLGYKERYYGVKLSYKRVDPNFNTMGAYYFSNDLESYTINPNFSLPNGMLRGNISIGIQKDNIRNQKQATNKRFIGTANIAGQLTKEFGVDLLFSNFSNNQSPKTLSFADSLKIVQTTQVLSITPKYFIQGERFTHMIMVSANLSGMKDYNSYFDSEAQTRNINTNQYMASYTINIPAINLSLFSNLNYTQLKRSDGEDTYQGVGFGGNYSFLENKAQFGLNSNIMQGKSAYTGKSLIINGSLNGRYRLSRMHSISLQLFVTNNNPGTAIIESNPQFTETRGELAYQFNF